MAESTGSQSEQPELCHRFGDFSIFWQKLQVWLSQKKICELYNYTPCTLRIGRLNRARNTLLYDLLTDLCVRDVPRKEVRFALAK